MKFKKQEIPFTMVANEVLTRTDLSLKAKGLFAYLFSKPEGWQFSSKRMTKEHKESHPTIQATLRELEESGLLERVRLASGRVEYNLSYAEPTHTPGQETLLGDPESRKARVKKSHRGKTLPVSNIETENKKDIVIAPKGAGAKDPEEPLSQEQFVTSCKASPQRHIQIIGEWAEAEGPKHTRRGQWDAFLRRNLRAARELVAFTTPEIESAYHKMMKDVVQETGTRKTGFLTRYTLETLAKYTTA